MRQTGFDVDARTGRTELGVRVDTLDTDRLNAIERRENPTGFTAGRTMRAVAEIPVNFLATLALQGDRDGKVLFNVDSTPMEKRVALRRMLFRYPEFRVSEGRL
jgi:hypothetical protein